MGASTVGGMGQRRRGAAGAGARVVVSGLASETLEALASEIGGRAIATDVIDRAAVWKLGGYDLWELRHKASSIDIRITTTRHAGLALLSYALMGVALVVMIPRRAASRSAS